jgi:SAM-dependent methyltransferase
MTGDEIYARTYDATPLEWPGELLAYARWASQAATGQRPRVLELACGSGRIAIPLADAGCDVWGVDRSASMIEVARARRSGNNPRWLVGDMRSFDIDGRFDIALIPAHAFQYMRSPADQLAALGTVHRHLEPLGLLVVHLDRPGHAWLASLCATPPAPEERKVGALLRDPATGSEWRRRSAWTFDPATEVATLHSDWVRLGEGGANVECTEDHATAMKVIGRGEMEHALLRAGFEILALYGDFAGGPPTRESGDMIWLARRLLATPATHAE